MNKQLTGKFKIDAAFKITGRGLALAGDITEGAIQPGDLLEFTAFDKVRLRIITGVEYIRNTKHPKGEQIGLLIKCENDLEIEELLDWRSEGAIAAVWKADMVHNMK